MVIYMHCWASLVVRWLRLHLPLQWVQVPSLVGEQRSHKPYIVAKRKGKKDMYTLFLKIHSFWGRWRNWDISSVPGSGRFLGGGNDLLQYSCLENPMDRGAWRATSPWGRLSGLHFHSHLDLKHRRPNLNIYLIKFTYRGQKQSEIGN